MLLALDLATIRSGFAVGCPERGRIASGHFLQPVIGERYGQFLAHYVRLLERYFEKYEITSVVYEKPILLRTDKISTMKRILSMAVRTEEFCFVRNVHCEPVGSGTWRKHFIGTGKAPENIGKFKSNTDWLKAEAIKVCAWRGWEVKTDDEAEALGIMDWWLCVNHPEYAARTSLIAMGGAA